MNNYQKARKNFLEAAKIIFAQDPELESPNIIIEPIEGLVQKAVDELKKIDPNYFKGVRKIVIKDEPAYGHVESGPGKDPAVIHLNFPRIKRELSQKLKAADPNATSEEIDKEIIKQLAATIGHERGHVGSFKPESGFAGGEVPAEQEEQRIYQKLK